MLLTLNVANENELVYAVAFTTLIILLLIAGVVITIINANRGRLQQEMTMVQMQMNYEKEIRLVEQEVQEQVLVNVSRELHDNIGQLLTLMRFQIEQEKLDAADPARLKQVDTTLADVMQQLRLLGRSLNSEILEQNGLLYMMQQEVNRLSHFRHMQIHWQHDDTEPHLVKDQRLMAFRIFQETINNTLKHAKAKNIYISFHGDRPFHLMIKDDGKGFDLEQAMDSASGSGLKNIVKRAALANLHCEIVAAAGKGSTFTLKEMPINQ